MDWIELLDLKSKKQRSEECKYAAITTKKNAVLRRFFFLHISFVIKDVKFCILHPFGEEMFAFLY